MPLNPLKLGLRTSGSAYQDPLEVEKSLFRKIGDPVLSGVAKVANLIDVPASIGRDIVGGIGTGNWDKYNPLDQLLSPLSHKDRVFYRDLLPDLGIMQKNKETGFKGWLDDPMEGVRDLGAFGLDIATDPFFFAPKQTLSALGATGRGIGKVADKVTDFVPYAKPIKAKAAELGGKAKLLGARLFDPDVRGVHSYDPNIHSKARNLSAAERANEKKILGEHIHFLNRMKKEGLTDEKHQQMIRDLLEDTRAVSRNDAGEIIWEPEQWIDELQPDGTTIKVKDPTLRPLILPKVEPGQVPDTIREYVDFVKGRQPQTLEAGQASGGRVKALEDEISYAHRQASETLLEAMAKNQPLKQQRGQLGGDKRPMGAKDPRDMARSRTYKGFAGGSNEVNELLSNPLWRTILDNAGTDKRALSMMEDLMGIDRFNDPNALLKFADKYQLKAGTDSDQAIMEAAEQLANRYYGATVQKEFLGKVKTKETDPLTGEVVETIKEGPINRHKQLSRKLMDYQKEFQEAKGLYTNSPVVDAFEGELAATNQVAARDNLLEILADKRYHEGSYIPTQGKTQGERIDRILDTMNVNKDKYTERIANKMGHNVPTKDQIDDLTKSIEGVTDPKLKMQMTKQLAEITAERKSILKQVRNTRIDNDTAKALEELNPNFRMPEEVGELQKFWRNFSGQFKAGVLTWPARYVRDVTSAMVRLFENGRLDMDSVMKANAIVQGREVKGLHTWAPVKEWLEKNGRPLTDQEGQEAVREMFAAYRGSDVFSNTDLPHALPNTGKIDPYLELLPGQHGTMNLKGVTEGGTWNPLKMGRIRGTYPMLDRAKAATGKPRQETEAMLFKIGERVGRYTDEWGRMTGFLNGLKNAHKTGARPEQIMDEVNKLLVNYSPKNFTKFDRAIKQIVPFWSFMKAQVPHVFRELTTSVNRIPRQMVRAQNAAAGDPEQFLPEYISDTASIPLGKGEDGSERFLGGLGLMHEDPLQFASGSGVSDFLSEVGSRLHPGIKGPLEYTFDKSLFRKDMMLDELDPTVGRIATNLGLQDPLASGRAKPFPSKLMEHALANSPASRLLTTARMLGDNRKDPLAKATNLLTGARIVDVPGFQREGIIRDTATKQIQGLNPRSFKRTYFGKDEIARAAQEDPEAAQQMVAYNELIALLNNLAKERGEAKKKSENSQGIAAR
jgi:hypothetical protein